MPKCHVVSAAVVRSWHLQCSDHTRMLLYVRSLSRARSILEVSAAIALEVPMAFIWLPIALSTDNCKRLVTPLVSSIWLSASASSHLLDQENFHSLSPAADSQTRTSYSYLRLKLSRQLIRLKGWRTGVSTAAVKC